MGLGNKGYGSMVFHGSVVFHGSYSIGTTYTAQY